MATPAPSAAYDKAREVLDRVVDCLADNGRVVPDVNFVSPGAVAWEPCELLAIEVSDVKPSAGIRQHGSVRAAGGIRPSGPKLWAATAKLTLVRCVPQLTDDGEMANADVLQDAARELHTDAMVMLACLGCSQEPCWPDDPDGYRIQGPQGNAVAVVIELKIPLGVA